MTGGVTAAVNGGVAALPQQLQQPLTAQVDLCWAFGVRRCPSSWSLSGLLGHRGAVVLLGLGRAHQESRSS